MWHWWNSIISGEIPLHINSSEALLIEKSIQKRSGVLSSGGALVVHSGKFTGRATKDKYVIKDDVTENLIDWTSGIHPLDDHTFEEIKIDILKRFHILKPELYIIERSVGADENYSMGVNLITSSPYHALFFKIMMREKKDSNSLGEFTIYHDPELELDTKIRGLNSSTAVVINLKKREILIAGTAYCGEIKKAVFTVMNLILPDLGVLPMHAGANMDEEGKVCVFFGLSGTGKTSLSTDIGMKLIGDDEHGLSDNGVFNLEGGCYAKTYNLDPIQEPEIFKATNRFGSLIENVILEHETRRPIFESKTVTENGRSSYPLSSLGSIVENGRGKIPSHFFFLSADAMGVLPLISKLDNDQAIYYFLLGYTAKVAGTESGLKGITATFSHCFGAPFMLRKPSEYGKILKEFLDKHLINVWLLNTGWYGGIHSVGKRYDLNISRSCIKSIQKGELRKLTYSKDPVFNLSIPESLEFVEDRLLKPQLLWKNQSEYFSTANHLKTKFDQKYKDITQGQGDAFFNQEHPRMH